MHERERGVLLTAYSLVIGLAGLLALAWASQAQWTDAPTPLLLFLLLLSFAVKRLGFRVAPVVTHSLGSTVDIASMLVLGPALGGVTAALSSLLFTATDAWRRRQINRRHLVEVPLFNAGLKGSISLLCGYAYQSLGGVLAPANLSQGLLLPVLVLCLLWVVLDHLGWGVMELLRVGRAGMLAWLRTVLLASVLVELAPLPIAVLMAVIWGGLGTPAFLLAALVLAALAGVVGRLAETTVTLGERVDELSALNEMGHSILQARLDVDQLCELIYQRASVIVDTSTFHLGLFEGDDYAMKVWVRRGERQPPSTYSMGGREGIVGWMRQSRQPLLVRDFQKELSTLPAKPRYISPEPPRSAIFVPLLAGDEMIGAITVQGDEPAAFTQGHLRLLTNIANQAAAALENARLYQALQEEAWHLNALLQVAENIVTATDLDEVLSTIVRLTPLLMGAERCAVLLYQRAEDAFWPAQAYGVDREASQCFSSARYARDGDGALAAMWQNRVQVSVSDANSPLARGLGMCCFMMVPLIARAEIIGALCVDQGTLSRPFSASQKALIAGIANQAAVAIENAQLQVQADEKVRLEHELELARQIQSSLLPACCPHLPGYELGAEWRSARQVSGDFYDFIPLPGGKWGFLIADVSDKGVPAALFMALSRSLIRSGIIGADAPTAGLKRANEWILKDTTSGQFVTVFYGVLDLASHQVTYVNCGHNPPLLISGSDGTARWIKAKGTALGLVDTVELEEHTLTLGPGDTLLLYTDGVTEATDREQAFFGAERLGQVATTLGQSSADEVIQRVAEAVSVFVGGAPQADDITLVALRRTP